MWNHTIWQFLPLDTQHHDNVKSNVFGLIGHIQPPKTIIESIYLSISSIAQNHSRFFTLIKCTPIKMGWICWLRSHSSVRLKLAASKRVWLNPPCRSEVEICWVLPSYMEKGVQIFHWVYVFFSHISVWMCMLQWVQISMKRAQIKFLLIGSS